MNFVSIITNLDIVSKYERIDNIKWVSPSVPEDISDEMRRNSKTFRLLVDLDISCFHIREVLPEGYTVLDMKFFYRLIVVRIKIEDETSYIDVWDILIREFLSMLWTNGMRKYGLPLSKLQYKVLDKLSSRQTEDLRMLVNKIDDKMMDRLCLSSTNFETDPEVEYLTTLIERMVERIGNCKLVSMETMTNQKSCCHHITLDNNGNITSFFVKNLSVYLPERLPLSQWLNSGYSSKHETV